MIGQAVLPVTSVFLLISVVSGVHAAEWYVDGSVAQPGDGKTWETAFKTIQEGIDAASHGDTVIVAEETYVENIHFGGKNIVLRSTDPLDLAVVENTVIDGDQAGPVVSFSGSEDKTCVLSGFTVQNGRAEYGGGVCGGSSGNWTYATIENNVITQSSALGAEKSGGGGLYGCAGTIQNNTVTDNYAAVFGGGLHGCHGTIQNNTIVGNVADHKGGGLDECKGAILDNTISGNFSAVSSGGVRHCHGTIRSNVITGNVTEQVGGGLHTCHGTIDSNLIAGNWAGTVGGGLHNCKGTIQNNIISENSAMHGGGGVMECHGIVQDNLISCNAAGRRGGGLKDCHGTIQGNTIVANSSDDNGGGLVTCDGIIRSNAITGNTARLGGGGLAFCNAIIENNTISGNSAGTVGGGLKLCNGTIRNCIIWGNAATNEGAQLHDSSLPTYCCIQDWTDGGEGNFVLDPKFADVDGPDGDPETYEDNDYRLACDSPCIDQGKNDEWMSDAVDADGNPRILDGNRDGTAVVDMGAYEYVRQVGVKWYVNGAVSGPGDGKSWATAFVKIQEGIDAAFDGHTVIVAEGTYVENVRFNGKNITLTSTNPHSADVVANTIIDGSQAGSAVTFSGTEDETCVLSGFTIQNGKADSGGGICGGTQQDHTHATIEYNVITGNSTIESSIEWGGGLAFCDGVIRNNVITGNSAGYYGGGLTECNGIIRNNLIFANSATFGGGMDFCNGFIQSCVISGNFALFGGGMYECNGAINNSIIWGNSGDQLHYESWEQACFTHCCIQDWARGGEGNITADPLLVDGYRLSPDSPCIDAGKNEKWMWDAVDSDGNPRVWQGKSSLTVDMGAYEYGSFPFEIVSVVKSSGAGADLVWKSRPGDTYTVWLCSDLASGEWKEKTTVQSGGETTAWTDPDTSSSAMFYRIELK